VDQRERWQALQHHLKSARSAMDAGERGEALKHADAALALDPAFLAAQTLRERIVASSGTAARLPVLPLSAQAAPAAAAPAVAPARAKSASAPARTPTRPAVRPSLPTQAPFTSTQRPAPAPPRSSDALTQFEARARQRRLERRVAAARQHLADGQLAEARVALDEVRELDATHPELAPLLASLDAAEHPAAAVEHPLAAAEYPAAPAEPRATAVEHPLAAAEYPAAAVEHPLAAAEYPAAPAEHRATALEHPLAAAEYPAIAVEDPLAAAEYPAAAVEHPLAAAEYPGISVEHPLAAAEYPAAPAEPRATALEHPVAAAEYPPITVEHPLAAAEYSVAAAEDLAATPEAAQPEQGRKRSRLRPWIAAAAAAFAGLAFAAYRVQRSAAPDLAGGSASVAVAVTAPAVVSTTGIDAAAVDAAPRPFDASSPAPADAPHVDSAPGDAPVLEPPAAKTARVAAASATTSSDATPESPLVRSVSEAPRPLPQAPVPAPADTVAAVLPAVGPPPARFDPSPSLGIPADLPRQFAAAPMPAPLAAPPARALAPAAATVPTRPDDTQQVRELLQRYRSAYQELSAAHARAIWPAVNEPALQRAFEGLESQTLTFNACDVQLRGVSTATATCRGTAEYVPKVGSREPHVEPRVWNFTLQKTGEMWQIQTARTER
jgi:hypothetical protein